MSGKAWDPKIWDAIKEQCDELPDGLPLYPIDPPRSQALEEPAPVVNQTLTAPPGLMERLCQIGFDAGADHLDVEDHWSDMLDGVKETYRIEIRAVLSELANTAHANALPIVQAYADELLGECGQHVPMPAWDDLDPARQACFLDMANAARNLALAALAAKDARLAELAAMGGEALPSDETVEDLALDILHNHASDDEDAALKIAQAVLRQCHEFIMPILAAKDATIAEQKRTIEVQTACIVAVVSERDAALAEVARLKAEAEAMARRVRILEIAPKAAMYASRATGAVEDVQLAVDVICAGSGIAADVSPWAKSVLEYVAREGST